MPRLSDSMEEGTILKWLKATGDEVRLGEALAEIETDKATMTYEADAAGFLQIVAGEGDTLPIGAVIARLAASAADAAPTPSRRSRQPPTRVVMVRRLPPRRRRSPSRRWRRWRSPSRRLPLRRVAASVRGA